MSRLIILYRTHFHLVKSDQIPKMKAEINGLIKSNAQVPSVLITCASFEERSMALIKRLSRDYRVNNSFIFRSNEYGGMGKSPEYFQTIHNRLLEATESDPTIIDFSMEHSIPSMAKFEKLLCGMTQSDVSTQAIVDITTFPRQELLMLLRVIDNEPQISTKLFYAEPREYATEHVGGWLTGGVKSVRPVPGFGGIQPPNKKKNLLIMFLGHEEERTAITWKRHQPRKTVAILPDPNYRQEMNGIVERTHQPLFTKLSPTEFYPNVPAHGIRESEMAVLNIWEQYHETHYIVVAPLGTKLQTLGVYRAAKQKADIQVTYALPSIYNYEKYSLGIGRCWEIDWMLSN